MIKVGCCGWPIAKGTYLNSFQVIELQNTFYKIPQEKLLLKWRKKGPASFEFVVKAFQGITHHASSPTWKKFGDIKAKRENYGGLQMTPEVFESFDKTLAAAKVLNADKILIQLPTSFEETVENAANADRFFEKIKGKATVALELRGWSPNGFAAICKRQDLIQVTDPLRQLPEHASEIAYFRLHGEYRDDEIRYFYKYSAEELGRLAEIVRSCKSRDIYVMFNNSYMADSAREFMKLISTS